MKYSSILAATVAVGALMGVNAPVQAKVVKRVTTKTTTSSGTQAAEIRALRAELQELKARLDARDAQVANVPAQAAETQAAVTQAQTQAAQAQTTAVAAQATADKASKDTSALAKAVAWAKDTTVSGRMYFNASYIDHKTNGVRGANLDNGGGFAIKRFYVSIDHKFSDVFSANLTMDVDNILRSGTTLGAVNTTGNTNQTGAPSTNATTDQGFYIKKAFLQAKISPAFIVRAGSADMPWIPYVENVYGYRHIEQTLTDRAKFGTSADWGIHVLGDLAGGLVSYQFSAVDGGTYRSPRFTQTIDLEGRISAKYMGFEAAVGGYVGKNANDVQTGLPTTARLLKRLDGLLAYKGKVKDIPFTLGGEYVYSEDKNPTSFVPVVYPAHDKGEGFSVFGSVQWKPKWSTFARFDSYKPSEVNAYSFKDQYANVGLQWSPAKIVDLALTYKHESVKGGNIAPGNVQYAIGCTSVGGAPCGKGTWDEVGIYGQFRW